MRIMFLHGFAAGGAVWAPYRAEFPDAPMPTLQFSDNGIPTLPELTGPAILVGWSMGAMIAVEMLRRQPQFVKGLLLVSSGPSFVASDIFPEGKAPSAVRELRDAVATGDAKAIQSFQKQLFTAAEIRDGWLARFRREIGPSLRNAATTAHPQSFRQLPATGSRPYRSPDAGEAGGVSAEQDSLLSQLAFLENYRAPAGIPAVPVALLHGGRDAIVDAAATAAWRRLFPGATARLVAEAGHALPFVRRDEVTAAIAALREACDA